MYAMLNATVEAAIDLEDKLATAVSVPIEQPLSKAAMHPYLQVLENLPAVKYGEQIFHLWAHMFSTYSESCRAEMVYEDGSPAIWTYNLVLRARRACIDVHKGDI